MVYIAKNSTIVSYMKITHVFNSCSTELHWYTIYVYCHALLKRGRICTVLWGPIVYINHFFLGEISEKRFQQAIDDIVKHNNKVDQDHYNEAAWHFNGEQIREGYYRRPFPLYGRTLNSAEGSSVYTVIMHCIWSRIYVSNLYFHITSKHGHRHTLFLCCC